MNRGGSRISEKWVQISCVKMAEGGVVAFYLIFIPPPTRLWGYSDQPVWRLPLEKACALNNFNTLRDILITFSGQDGVSCARIVALPC